MQGRPDWVLLLAGICLLAVVALVPALAVTAWRRAGVRPRLGPDGVQEVRIRIRKGYHPDRIRVRTGVPVRLRLVRDEDDRCSERFILPEFGVDRRMRPYESTSIEFIPTRPGEYLFTCAMGMYLGKLVVDDSR